MTCPVSEEQLALYSGNDLSAEESAGVSEHLVNCVPCRQTLADLQVSLQFFSEISAAPEREDLQSLHNGVMQQVRNEHTHRHLRRVAAIAASLGLVIAPLLLRDKAHDGRTTVVASVQSLPPAPIPSFNAPDLVPVPVYHRPRKRNSEVGLRDVAFNTRPEGRSELRISTADPNVVILLETDGNIHEN